MIETWLPIKEYNGLYEVSNTGKVKSLARQSNWGVGRCNVKEKILKENIDTYVRVGLSKNAKVKLYLVHRLVAQAFIPNPNNLPIVMHIDDNPFNNNVSNLICGTKYLNSQDMKLKGRARNQYTSITI